MHTHMHLCKHLHTHTAYTLQCGCSHAKMHLFFSSEALISEITQLPIQQKQPTVSRNCAIFLNFFISFSLPDPQSRSSFLHQFTAHLRHLCWISILFFYLFVSLSWNLSLDNRQSPGWLFHNTGCMSQIATAHISWQYLISPSHVKPVSVCFLKVSILFSLSLEKWFRAISGLSQMIVIWIRQESLSVCRPLLSHLPTSSALPSYPLSTTPLTRLPRSALLNQDGFLPTQFAVSEEAICMNMCPIV